MRYRIKRVKEGCIDGSVFFDDIIELEKIDEPEELTMKNGSKIKITGTNDPFVGCEPKEKTLKDAVAYGVGIEQDGKTIPPKEFYREETLEEKLDAYFVVTKTRDSVIKITKEHCQKHPEEIHEGFWEEFAVIANKRLNLVSLDKVLEVFDEAKKSLVMIGYNTEISFIRKALEQLKEKE